MMEGINEVKRLVKAWFIAFASLTLCFLVATKVPKGVRRLLFLIPIISLFTFLPLNLSYIHFCAFTSIFLTWLCNFKLVLFAFNQGPLSSPNLSLLHFVAIACLPIKIQQDQPQHHKFTKKGLKSALEYTSKFLVLAVVIKTYDYRPYINQNLILALYCLHVYLALEIVLAISVVPARAIFGFKIEQQFNDPYLSTSLQDFWGKRWNLMVTSILRPTVYLPIRSTCVRIIGQKSAQLVALLMSFLVSGLMHELIYSHLSRAKPTWEVTWYFILQGVCTSLEIGVKHALGGRWQLHPVISGLLTIGFVAGTGFWLFFAQIVDNQIDMRAIAEYKATVDIMRSALYKAFS